MAVYGNMVITNQGAALYGKVQAGATLTFTRMQIGSGQLAQGQDPTTLTALISPIDWITINSITQTSGTANIRGIYENTNLTQSTYTCEIGLFAQDPDVGEILYAYANAGAQGDTFPPYADGPFSRQFQINAAVGNATNVTANIPANTYVPTSAVGTANGVAPLGADGQVPASYLGHATVGPATSNALGTVELPASAGSPSTPITPYRAATVLEQQLTTTSATTILSYTPAAQGNFEVSVSLRVTATTNITLQIKWTDASGNQQTDTRLSNQSVPAGTWDVPIKFLNATTAAPISVIVTAGTANVLYASATIKGV
ncbi:MAG: hypothetical protein K6T83_01240 [Alicyclobacillus sp.]|nr:hypothetical protein [Alicyclobacillus sp.]